MVSVAASKRLELKGTYNREEVTGLWVGVSNNKEGGTASGN